jgi:hypothetical protein
MRVGGLWEYGSIILMPNIGVSSRIDAGEKNLRAFKVGRLKRIASEIIDVVLEPKEIFSQGYSR